MNHFHLAKASELLVSLKSHYDTANREQTHLKRSGFAWLLLLLASLFFAPSAWAENTEEPAHDEEFAVRSLHEGDRHVSSRLIVSHETVEPNGSFVVGVAFQIDPEWYIYWQNPGDVGGKEKASNSVP